jgi:hypothetical protein
MNHPRRYGELTDRPGLNRRQKNEDVGYGLHPQRCHVNLNRMVLS